MRIRSFTTLGSFLLLAAASVYGQAPTADIPFEFHVGNVILPAGHYEVTVDARNSQNMLSVECITCQAHALVPTYGIGGGPKVRAHNETAVYNGRLVFDKYGDTYFLAEVWSAGSTRGSAVNKSNMERELARTTPPAQTSRVLLAER